jgi:hypothetical protein
MSNTDPTKKPGMNSGALASTDNNDKQHH